MYSSIKNKLSFLVENSSKINSLGLVNGKLGLAMNLYYSARFFEDINFSLHADQLIDDIISSINVNLPPTFDYGLFGIGWGLLDLIENKMLEGGVCETFVEVDDIYMKIQGLAPPQLYQRNKGSIGRSLYVVKRLQLSNDDSFYNLNLNGVALSSVDSCLISLNYLYECSKLDKQDQLDISFILLLVLSFKELNIYPYKINKIAYSVFERVEYLGLFSLKSCNVYKEMFRIFVLLFFGYFSNLLSINHILSSYYLNELSFRKQFMELNLEDASIYLFLFQNFTKQKQNDERISLIVQKIETIIGDSILAKNKLVNDQDMQKNLTNGLWGFGTILKNKY